MATYEEKQFKTIINKLKYIDGWFWCRYTVNPYSGCEHACVYCDARSQKYYLHPEFEEIIYVKKNAAEMLDSKLKRARTMLPDVVALGGVCDAYQPAEKIYLNTQKILKILLKHGYTAEISTKSNLVTRDGEILSQIARKTGWCTVMFTITTTDKEVFEFLEPGASTPGERFDAIRKMKRDFPDVQVGTNFMPIVPFLEDSDENIEGVIKKSKEAGADFVLFAAGMSMQDLQKDFFLKRLKKRYPGIYEDFIDLYEGKMHPKSEWIRNMSLKAIQACEKHKIPHRMKRYIPKDFRRVNYKVAEYLINKAYALEVQGKKHDRYQWAGLLIQNLNESLDDIAARNELQKIKNVDKQIETEIKPFLKKKVNLDSFL
ncbi:MAG: radical SAM protein [Candidatus Hodarchaeota archaeon]